MIILILNFALSALPRFVVSLVSIKFKYQKRAWLVGWVIRLITVSLESLVEFIDILMLFNSIDYIFHLIFAIYLGLSIILNLYFTWIAWSYSKTSIFPSTSKVMVFNMNVEEMNNFNPFFYHHPQPQRTVNKRNYMIPGDNFKLNFYDNNQPQDIGGDNKNEEELKEENNQLNPSEITPPEKKLMSSEEINRLFNLPPKPGTFLPPITQKKYIPFEEPAAIDFYKSTKLK